MKREDGFYWVKYRDEWCIAEWTAGIWYHTGSELSFSDAEMDKIDEKRLIR